MKLTNIFGKTVEEIATAMLRSGAVRGMIDRRIAQYASLRNIEISAGAGVTATLHMLGENSAITVHVGDAEFSDDGSQVILRGLSSDRPWLNNLLASFMEGRAIPLPPEASDAVEILRPLLS